MSVVRSARGGTRLVVRHLGLAARRRLVRIPMDRITDEFAFSLSVGGWHPFVQALRDHDRRPDLPPGETLFGKFFLAPEVNAARTLNDVLDLSTQPLGLGLLPPFWLGTYPWGGLSAGYIGRTGPAFGWAHDQAEGVDTADLWGHGRTLWYRPDNRHTIGNEHRLTIELYHSMRRQYSPLRARGFPRVTVLERPDGEQRALIVDGHHRLAVLAHLGVRTVTVEIEATVTMDRAEGWDHVRAGRCSVAEAQRFFDAFFTLDGSERLARVMGGRRVNDAG